MWCPEQPWEISEFNPWIQRLVSLHPLPSLSRHFLYVLPYIYIFSLRQFLDPIYLLTLPGARLWIAFQGPFTYISLKCSLLFDVLCKIHMSRFCFILLFHLWVFWLSFFLFLHLPTCSLVVFLHMFLSKSVQFFLANERSGDLLHEE